jgi:carboxypeptidase C (cathepsin A)
MDLVCNVLGLEETFNNLEWNGKKGFEVKLILNVFRVALEIGM